MLPGGGVVVGRIVPGAIVVVDRMPPGADAVVGRMPPGAGVVVGRRIGPCTSEVEFYEVLFSSLLSGDD